MWDFAAAWARVCLSKCKFARVHNYVSVSQKEEERDRDRETETEAEKARAGKTARQR